MRYIIPSVALLALGVELISLMVILAWLIGFACIIVNQRLMYNN